MDVPSYADLPRPAGESLPLAWGVFGQTDQIGTWNHVTDASVAAASRLIRTGRRFNLNLPLHMPLGPLPAGSHPLRLGPSHEIFHQSTGGLPHCDDRILIYPQASSQWDGLHHVGDPMHGFYNWRTIDDVKRIGDEPSGIETLSVFGLASRAVLVDLPTHFAATGRRWVADASMVATADDLAAALARTGERLEPGDVLLVRTGWLEQFLGAAPGDQERLFTERRYSGLSGGEDMWAFLWDNRVAAVAADNVAVEAFPINHGGANLHIAIARLGLTLGELFVLDELAEFAASAGRYSYFFTSGPLSVRAGIGSPPNAMVIA